MCENSILYELSLKSFSKVELYSLYSIECMFFIMLLIFIFKYENERISELRSLKRFLFVFILLAGGLSITFTISYMSRLNSFVNEMEINRKVVEGEVGDFKRMHHNNKENEKFYVDDVFFSYSDYIVGFGYNKSRGHGGVIKGNGQVLRIEYVTFMNENCMVKIEGCLNYETLEE